MALVLHGFRYSVYVRVARVALAEKGLAYEHIELDPFAPDMPVEYLDLHPFKRVPTLVDGDFVLYETEAITRYIDEAFPGQVLQPTEPRYRARISLTMLCSSFVLPSRSFMPAEADTISPSRSSWRWSRCPFGIEVGAAIGATVLTQIAAAILVRLAPSTFFRLIPFAGGFVGAAVNAAFIKGIGSGVKAVVS
jgi:glutathione S-transferase